MNLHPSENTPLHSIDVKIILSGQKPQEISYTDDPYHSLLGERISSFLGFKHKEEKVLVFCLLLLIFLLLLFWFFVFYG